MTTTGGAKTIEAWALVRAMLDDMTTMIHEDAESELEVVEGYRVLARTAAMCSEISLDVDPARPWFFPMTTEVRYLAAPNPDGEYYLCMIDGDRRYQVTGNRGTSSYLGFQILAGVGLTPRRQAGYLSDRDLAIDSDGRFSIVLSTAKPTAEELGDAVWLKIPADASAIVVREYIADRASEQLVSLDIEPLDDVPPPAVVTDDVVALQLTSMAWTIAKLMTLHRTIKPELLEQPNQLLTATASDLGDADTTPDNLYMIGTFRLAPDESLVIEFTPPDTRYWNVTVESIWHECIDVRRRRSSITNAAAVRQPDGTVRVAIGATDVGLPNWLDTGGHHRGFVVLRWLDNPEAPPVSTAVVTSR
ncbi:MAG: DUF1214 domain-containing protein [Frankiaceae bacterium]|nr:DUF1214 domain-containing protein [Frankiaceae bacterium]MBV9871408.1 DUF1214 domain-containing protein [Frankiaceae bacterium]